MTESQRRSQKKYREKNKERRYAQTKAYKIKLKTEFPELVKLKQREYYRKNKKKVLANQRKWRSTEAQKQKRKEYNQRIKERHRAYMIDWFKKHPEYNKNWLKNFRKTLGKSEKGNKYMKCKCSHPLCNGKFLKIYENQETCLLSYVRENAVVLAPRRSVEKSVV